MYCEIKYIKYDFIKTIKEITIKILIPSLIIFFIIAYLLINYVPKNILTIITILFYVILCLHKINKAYKYCKKDR